MNMMHARTYDLTNLETKVNTKRYMRWHTTFSHNVTSVLSENVVRVPAENSFQPTHSMIVQNRNLKLGTSHTQTPVHACDVSLPTSSPY